MAAALPRLVIGWLGRFLLYRVTLKLSRHVFAQSEPMKEALRARGVAVPITAVPMGVDTTAMRERPVTPSDHPFYQGRRVLLYLGTLDAERRLEVPLAGAAEVMALRPDSVLALVGGATAAERAPLERLFEQAGLSDRVLFLGHLPLAEALRHVSRADVCLSPVPVTRLLAVGTATKLTEYLALGRQVVANDHPDQKLVIEGSGLGVLVDFSSAGFRDGIRRALELGDPHADQVESALRWIGHNRDYNVLSRNAAAVYKDLAA